MSGEGKGLPRPLVLIAALFVCLAFPAAAAATTRYAAPGGAATAAQCTTPATPCTINEAATGTGVLPADEVVVAPGSYSDTAGDLGIDGSVNPIAGNIHGILGQPRPVITLDQANAFGAITASTGVTVSYLSIESTVSDRAIFIGGGIVDDVIARGTGGFGATCQQTSGVIRNTACIATASNGTAAGVSVGTSGALSPTLRNVTAISLGASGFGLDYRVSGGGSLTVSVKSVIADGGSADIRVGGTSPSTTTMTVDHSNYATTSVLAGGTITDGGNNQTTAPALAADHVHQLTGSPTINAGAVDGNSGTTDVDGQPRTLDGTPDIGADELGHTTSMSISCAPPSVFIGGDTTCAATVTDLAGSPTTPIGIVGFQTDAGGTFSGGGTCTLGGSGATATCDLTYVPSQVGTGQLTASYVGDSTHDPSQGSTSFTVEALHSTTTAVSCVPSTLTLGAEASTCTATVTDTAGSPTVPTGSVGLVTTGAGTFGAGCGSLAAAGPGAASCTTTYTPSSAGTHQITGSYGGGPSHEASQGAAVLTAAAAQTTQPGTTVGPDPLCATLRKNLRKAKKARNKPKIRKLRRKLRNLGCV